jgi:Zn-dependent protease
VGGTSAGPVTGPASQGRYGRSLRPSPIFLAIVAAFAVCAWLAWQDSGEWAVFAFVVTGWVLSLCLHEFAHAAVAYTGGDRSVADKGYLTLDPRHYAEPGLSLVLPLLFVLMGGIGLPGGAVWIDRRALRSPTVASLVSLAGPATNVVFALVCLLPLGLGWIDLRVDTLSFTSGLAFLGFLQVTAAVLNLLPVPGLDGYGALEPHLSRELRIRVAPVGRWGLFAVIILLLLPGPNEAFFDTIDHLISATGTDPLLVREGLYRFQFWEQ